MPSYLDLRIDTTHLDAVTPQELANVKADILARLEDAAAELAQKTSGADEDLLGRLEALKTETAAKASAAELRKADAELRQAIAEARRLADEGLERQAKKAADHGHPLPEHDHPVPRHGLLEHAGEMGEHEVLIGGEIRPLTLDDLPDLPSRTIRQYVSGGGGAAASGGTGGGLQSSDLDGYAHTTDIPVTTDFGYASDLTTHTGTTNIHMLASDITAGYDAHAAATNIHMLASDITAGYDVHAATTNIHYLMSDVPYAVNTDLTGHAGTTNIHVAATDMLAFSGLVKITVGSDTPAGPATGDLWIDTN